RGADYIAVASRYEQFLMRRLRDAGQHKRAGEIASRQTAAFAAKSKGRLFNLNYTFLNAAIHNGDINAAEGYAERNRALLNEAKRWTNFPIFGSSWLANVEDGNARVAEARGLYSEAEASYHRAALAYMDVLKYIPQWDSRPAEGESERAADW